MKLKHSLDLYGAFYINASASILNHDVISCFSIISMAIQIWVLICKYEKQRRAWRLDIIRRLRNCNAEGLSKDIYPTMTIKLAPGESLQLGKPYSITGKVVDDGK